MRRSRPARASLHPAGHRSRLPAGHRPRRGRAAPVGRRPAHAGGPAALAARWCDHPPRSRLAPHRPALGTGPAHRATRHRRRPWPPGRQAGARSTAARCWPTGRHRRRLGTVIRRTPSPRPRAASSPRPAWRVPVSEWARSPPVACDPTAHRPMGRPGSKPSGERDAVRQLRCTSPRRGLRHRPLSRSRLQAPRGWPMPGPPPAERRPGWARAPGNGSRRG